MTTQTRKEAHEKILQVLRESKDGELGIKEIVDKVQRSGREVFEDILFLEWTGRVTQTGLAYMSFKISNNKGE